MSPTISSLSSICVTGGAGIVAVDAKSYEPPPHNTPSPKYEPDKYRERAIPIVNESSVQRKTLSRPRSPMHFSQFHLLLERGFEIKE